MKGFLIGIMAGIGIVIFFNFFRRIRAYCKYAEGSEVISKNAIVIYSADGHLAWLRRLF